MECVLIHVRGIHRIEKDTAVADDGVSLLRYTAACRPRREIWKALYSFQLGTQAFSSLMDGSK
jgi:hypothetical protein